MSRGYIKNIFDLERIFYGGERFAALRNMIMKSDSNLVSTTSGVYNAVFGAQVWSQLNQEANIFGALPKTPWDRDGWRVMTARGPSNPSGGVAEDASLADTTTPTFVEISTKPKTVVHNFSVSQLQEFLAKSKNDAFGTMAQLRSIFAVTHREMINNYMTVDYDTLASNGIESIDRVTASTTETTNLSYTTGDEDMYSVDRSGNSVYDGQSLEASGTDRAITDTLLRTLIGNTNNAGANATGQGRWWLTGWDTNQSILGQYETAVRYNFVNVGTFKIGVNGVSTQDGIGFGASLATLYGIPMIISKDIEKDTISRVYLLDISNPEGYDAPRLSFGTAIPTQYFEAGMNTGTPIELGRLGNEGMFVTLGELICRFFAVQGKIRDLL